MSLLTPLTSLHITKHLIPSHANLPNTSIQNKPLIHYHGAFNPSTLTTSSIETHLRDLGVVEPQWRYTMYSTTHYHSTTHEVLVITRGSARLCFGGEGNPERYEPVVGKGDVLVIPAGVAHRLLQDMASSSATATADAFEMVGSYPPGYDWDMCYDKAAGEEEEEGSVEKIRDLPWFQKDPIYGDRGPVLE